MSKRTSSTKEQLLDAAQELIQHRGLNAMSFQDLSDAVGIRKASVHHHFANKAEMVNTLVTRFLSGFELAVSDLSASRASGRTKLKRYFGLFEQTLEAGKNCLCGMLMAELLSLDEKGVNLIQQFLKNNLRYIRDILSEGVEDGSLSARANASGTAELILATVEGGLLLARCDGGTKQFTDMSGRLISFLTAD